MEGAISCSILPPMPTCASAWSIRARTSSRTRSPPSTSWRRCAPTASSASPSPRPARSTARPTVFPTPETRPFPVQTSLYGASKLAGEGLIAAYCEGFGFQGYIFRFVSILGERYTHGHVFDFYQQLRADPTRLQVLGDGKQRKSYLYVQDCIDAMLHAIEHAPDKVNVFNLGTDEYIAGQRFDRLDHRAARRLAPRSIYSGGDRGWIGDSPFIFLDTARIRALGWQPKLTIREGVAARWTGCAPMNGSRHGVTRLSRERGTGHAPCPPSGPGDSRRLGLWHLGMRHRRLPGGGRDFVRSASTRRQQRGRQARSRRAAAARAGPRRTGRAGQGTRGAAAFTTDAAALADADVRLGLLSTRRSTTTTAPMSDSCRRRSRRCSRHLHDWRGGAGVVAVAGRHDGVGSRTVSPRRDRAPRSTSPARRRICGWARRIDVFRIPAASSSACAMTEAADRLGAAAGAILRTSIWMRVESAEMIKHALNAFLAISRHLHQRARAHLRAGRRRRRRGRAGARRRAADRPKAYVRPGAAFAGGTLARDVALPRQIADANSVETPLIGSVIASNDAHKQWAVDPAAPSELGSLEGARIAVLGLTYKPGTDTLRRSVGGRAGSRARSQAARQSTVRSDDPAGPTCRRT